MDWKPIPGAKIFADSSANAAPSIANSATLVFPPPTTPLGTPIPPKRQVEKFTVTSVLPPKDFWKSIAAPVGAGFLIYGIVFGAVHFTGMSLPVSDGSTPPHISATIVPNDPVSLAKVEEVKPYYLRAVRGDGKIVLRTGGLSGWRYWNPCKVDYGRFARIHGAIGSDGTLAIFSNMESGYDACQELLFKDDRFAKLSIREAMKKWASKNDKYDPIKYGDNVAKAAERDVNTKLSDLTNPQQIAFMNQITQEEGWLEGKVTVFDTEDDWKKSGW